MLPNVKLRPKCAKRPDDTISEEEVQETAEKLFTSPRLKNSLSHGAFTK